MKIAVCTLGFPALSETFILYQITGLVQMGHDVSIFSLSRPKEPLAHPAVEQFGLLERTVYLDLPKGKLARMARGLAALLDASPRSRWRSPAALRLMMRTKWGLPHPDALSTTKWFVERADSYDLVHCHFGPTALLMLPIRLVLGVPFLTSFHGYDVSSFIQEKGDDVYWQLFRHGDLFTANTKHTASRLTALGCPPAKLLTHHAGITIDDLRFTPRGKPLDGPTRIVTIARLKESKGIEYAVRAVASLSKRGYAVRYDIVGEGDRRPVIEQLIRELGVEDHVHLLGAQPRPVVVDLLGRAHIFVLSSVRGSNGSEEGQGVVLGEAQACGLPVVATRCGGIPEAVIDGETAFLVPQRDADALAERLKYLIENPGLWTEMGTRGRQLVEREFSFDVLNKELVRIYEEAIAAYACGARTA